MSDQRNRLIWSMIRPELKSPARAEAEDHAHALGFRDLEWVRGHRAGRRGALIRGWWLVGVWRLSA